jgi:hypothetical protein
MKLVQKMDKKGIIEHFKEQHAGKGDQVYNLSPP